MSHRNFLQVAIIIISLIGILTVFSACSSESATTASIPATSAASTPTAATPTASKTTAIPITTTNQTPAAAKTRIITDMAGRKVEIPTVINTVYCAVPTAEAMIYSLAPEKMAAWVNKPSGDVINLLGGRAKQLPVLGGWMGEKVTANLEEMAKLAPDIIVWMGDPPTAKATAEAITQQTNRPVIVTDSTFAPTPAMYRMMGDILGVPERGEKLAAYCENAVKEVSGMAAKIPDDKKVTVYYAEGNGGLTTNPSGSTHTVVLDFVKGVNIGAVEDKSGAASSPVSMEQLLSWNPDVILVGSSASADTYNTVMTDSAWSQIKAVQNKRVYMTPSLPFPWFDRPPGIMRALGIYWCGNVLYPEYVNIDLNQKTREFCSLFYNLNLTDEQLNLLLKNAR
jgi:iron complex transport system substrate-binding protein